MSNLTKLFDYNGAKITFRNDEGVAYVNATQMAKPFGKVPNEYLRLPSTLELIEAITRKSSIDGKVLKSHIGGNTGKSRIDAGQLVMTKRGGKTPGTWMHEDIAIDFSQWLSIDFRLWCNDRIKELLNTGSTSLQTGQTSMPSSKQLAQMVIDAENKREEAERMLAIAMPRYDYVEMVFNSKNTFNVNEIAQDLGMTAFGLNKKLNELGLQYKQGGKWMLYAQYRNLGFTKQITMMKDGKTLTHTVWTEKGRAFIHKHVNPEMRMSVAKKEEQIHRLDKGVSLIN